MNSRRDSRGAAMAVRIKLLTDVIAERKNYDRVYVYLASVYRKEKFMELVETLEKGLENSLTSYKIIKTCSLFLIEIGQYDAAIKILKKGLSFIDDDPELWNYLGVAHWSKGDLQNAVEAYQRALILDENCYIVFNNLGSFYISGVPKLTKEEISQNLSKN